jgi:hypothetical protein
MFNSNSNLSLHLSIYVGIVIEAGKNSRIRNIDAPNDFLLQEPSGIKHKKPKHALLILIYSIQD